MVVKGMCEIGTARSQIHTEIVGVGGEVLPSQAKPLYAIELASAG